MINRMRSEGVTDYLALGLREERISYATCAPDGFSDAHLKVLRDTAPTLALQLDRAACRYALSSLSP
jgi:hypothetical protein